MKRLVDQIVNTQLESGKTSQTLQSLTQVLQLDKGKIILGTTEAYIEIAEGQISFVSGGQRVTFEELLQLKDLINRFSEDSTGGTDEDFDGIDPDDGLEPLSDDEALLT